MAFPAQAAILADCAAAPENLSIFQPVFTGWGIDCSLSMLGVLAITGGIFFGRSVSYCCTASFDFAFRAAMAREPPQVYGSKPIEVAWTAAPALIVFILVLVTTRTLWEVKVEPPKPRDGRQHAIRYRHRPPMVVGVSVRELRWCKLDFSTANELHVPASEDGSTAPSLPDAQVGRRLP